MTSSEQPERETAPAASETVLGETTVTVRRSPRIVNFLILGAVLGALVAVILTYAFPESAEFGRMQVMGFLLLLCVAVGVTLAALVALAIGRVVGRKPKTVVADRIGTRPSDADETAPGTDSSSTTSEN